MTVNFKYVRNQNEYHLFVKQMRDRFEYRQDWENFFGVCSMAIDEDIVWAIGSTEVRPPEYPCFLYCNFIDKTVNPRARVIDFLPVSKVISDKYKNWYRNLSMVINENILVDGVELFEIMTDE